MVNLEWYRTFKSVYKNGNFSLAAKELFISQPAVSQQIGMLEAHVGYTLFIRKSKGVTPTDYAKLLNNLIIEALDRLENVENGFRAKAHNATRLFTVGVSQHLFSSLAATLISKFEYIDFSFHDEGQLFELVNTKKLDFAICTQQHTTFDTLLAPIKTIQPIIVGSSNLDSSIVQKKLSEGDTLAVENWLNEQKWYSHDAGIPHVKLFWLHVFDKKRPSIIPNYIIPSEYEMLHALSLNNGLAICWDCNAETYLSDGRLKLVWESTKMPKTTVYLLSRKNSQFETLFTELITALNPVLP